MLEQDDLKQEGRLWLVAKVSLTVAVSVFFFYLFLRGIDLDTVWRSIEDADYELVPLALLLFAASLAVRALRWQTFYHPDAPGFRMLFLVLLMTYAGNNLLPLRAGEILRIQLLADRASLSRARSLGTAVLERLLDLLILGVFVVAGAFVVDIGLAFLGTGLVFAIASGCGLVLAAAIVHNPGLVATLMRRDLPIIPSSWSARLRSMTESGISGLSALSTWRLFGAAVVWTVLAWLLEFGMYLLIAKAFDIDESFLTIAFAGAAANLALSIPSAQGGVGPFQLVAKEALEKSGVAGNTAAAYALVLHALLLVPVSVVGLLVFLLTTARGRTVRLRPAEE
jgi:uncharacterized protein (TIRG00374 family)